MGKFWSFANLWARTVRDFEEGRLRRDSTGALRRIGPEPPAQGGTAVLTAPGSAARAAAAPSEPFDPGHIDRVAKELLEARRSCGIAADPSELASLRDGLLSRAKEISSTSGGKRVEFLVSVEDGKPKIKARLG